MKLCAADMPSYTFAIKAQKILKARGYFCEIKRKSDSSEGCGYYLSFSGDCGEVKRLLERYSLPFERLRDEVDRE